MNADQLRTALGELNGQRNVCFVFATASMSETTCRVDSAMLIPAEADGLVKVTDGHRVFIIDAERIAWIEIG